MSSNGPTRKEEEDEDDFVAAPRLEAGLDIHRRAHVLAAPHPAYLFQWRAFCERQKADWTKYASDEDEGFLAGKSSREQCELCTSIDQLIFVHTEKLNVYTVCSQLST